MTAIAFESFMRSLDAPRPRARWYHESDGDPHAMTHYVCHTQKLFTRIDCTSKADARELAIILNLNTPQ